MKSKAVIAGLVILLAFSIQVNQGKVESSEYIDLQNEYDILANENNKLKYRHEELSKELESIKLTNEKFRSEIEMHKKEIAELDGFIEDFSRFMKVYRHRNIYTDFVKDVKGTPVIENYDEYERAIFEAKNVEELFDLYRWNLDGAASEGYGANLYFYYKEIGEADFITKLGLRNVSEASGIAESLTGEMGLFFFNDGEINLSEHADSLIKYLEGGERSSKEKHIAFKIIAEIEEMIEYRKQHPDH